MGHISHTVKSFHTMTVEMISHTIEHADLCSRVCCCVNAANQAKLFFGHGTNVIVQPSKYL